MFTTAEKRRLRTSLPESVTASYTGVVDGSEVTRTTTVAPAYRWVGADSEGTESEEFDDYPIVLLDWDSQGEPVPGEELLNRFAERVFEEPDLDEIDAPGPLFDAEIDDEAFIETSETRQQASLSITPVVETKWVDGVPPQPRAEAFARACWRWVRFRGSQQLNSIGPDGERPMVVDGQGEPTPARMMNTYRVPMSAQIRYTASFVEVRAAATPEAEVTQ